MPNKTNMDTKTTVATSNLETKAALLSASEFLRQITPAARRSKLTVWATEIKQLREAGCSLSQIRAFLAHNGLSVAASTLSAFIERHQFDTHPIQVRREARSEGTQAQLKDKDASTTSPIESAIAFKTTRQLTAEHRELSKTEIRELYAKQFETRSLSPLADLLRQHSDGNPAANV